MPRLKNGTQGGAQWCARHWAAVVFRGTGYWMTHHRQRQGWTMPPAAWVLRASAAVGLHMMTVNISGKRHGQRAEGAQTALRHWRRLCIMQEMWTIGGKACTYGQRSWRCGRRLPGSAARRGSGRKTWTPGTVSTIRSSNERNGAPRTCPLWAVPPEPGLDGGESPAKARRSHRQRATHIPRLRNTMEAGCRHQPLRVRLSPSLPWPGKDGVLP